MDIPEYVKVFNTDEIIKNEFYILNTPGKNTQNSQWKDIKIEQFKMFFNVTMYAQIPNFIRNILPINHIDTERLLEDYRQNNFPNYPSRLACFFVFDNIDDVKKYKEDSHKNKDYKIYKIQISSNDYKITKHNMEYVSVLRVTYGYDIFTSIIEDEKLIHKYWSGEASNFDYSKYGSNNGIIQPLFEYLIEGEYTATLISD